MLNGVVKRLCGLVLVLAMSGCVTCPCRRARSTQPGICHVVLCWLKDSGNAEQRRQLIEVSKSFRSIPGVCAVMAGEVVPGEREIVDSSFDIGILLTFANENDMQAYLAHPDHTKAVRETLKPLVSKIVVYDFGAD